MIDLIRVFARLCPGAAYRLTSSVPPHTLIEWRGSGKAPTQAEIETCWVEIQAEPIKEEITLEKLAARLEKLETKEVVEL